MVSRPPEPLGPGGLYIHIPFCSRRCTYCDFATVAGRDDAMEPYLSALKREIVSTQPGASESIDTIFFGGGTPSRLSGEQLEGILGAVRSRFQILPGAEVTLESNPEDLTPDRLARFREAGINRLTVGVQSLDSKVLQAVGRGHGGRRALQAVEQARESGIGQVAVDLIAGLPGEDPRSWTGTLQRLTDLAPDHFSVYLLEMDKDTPLTRSMDRGWTGRPDDDTLADLWEQTTDFLEGAGYHRYEISNYAARIPGEPDRVARHNLKYWQDRPYAGFGLGAHAYHQGARRANRRELDRYISDLEEGRDPMAERDPWHPVKRLEEALFMGLRLRDGIDTRLLGARYGLDIQGAFEKVWETAEQNGLVVRERDFIRLTRAGCLRSNAVFGALIGHLPLE